MSNHKIFWSKVVSIFPCCLHFFMLQLKLRKLAPLSNILPINLSTLHTFLTMLYLPCTRWINVQKACHTWQSNINLMYILKWMVISLHCYTSFGYLLYRGARVGSRWEDWLWRICHLWRVPDRVPSPGADRVPDTDYHVFLGHWQTALHNDSRSKENTIFFYSDLRFHMPHIL